MNGNKDNGSTEYQKALDFLKEGCSCGCFKKVPQTEFAELREDFQALSKSKQDIFLMAQLKAMDGGERCSSKRLKKKGRIKKRTFYCWNHQLALCQKTYFQMLGIGKTYFENVKRHWINKGLVPRLHGNVKRMPQWKTKMVIDKNVALAVKNFLLNYAEVHGLPSPGKNIHYDTQAIVFLPTEMTYKSVCQDFLSGLEGDSNYRLLKYDAFRKLWHQLTPQIKILSPRIDLCDTCQYFRNALNYKAYQEPEVEGLLKEYNEHLEKAKLERGYYNRNTKLAKEQRKVVDQYYSMTGGKIRYSSIDATAHYSYDWAQSIHVPHSSQQIGKMYYLSPRKVHLFGIHNEAIQEQINYILDEQEIIGKGANGTLSMVFSGIKKLNKGEKHLKITCDNCGGQNKNNPTIWFYLYLVICGYYESIELNFMVPGHTKFKCDGNFGLIKKLYRKSTVECVDHVVDVVRKSSLKGLNKAQRYIDGKGFWYLDIASGLEPYFKRFLGIKKFQHFLFTSSKLGIVKAQEVAEGPFQEFRLLKANKEETSDMIKNIRILSFSILTPPPLELERQEYLYNNIRPLVKEEYKNITCPIPAIS